MISPTSLYGIKYFPQGMFTKMWVPSAWPGGALDTGVVAADFALIKELGFNTARLTLEMSTSAAPDSSGSFDFQYPLSTQMTRLNTVLGLAGTAGIQLQLCLFGGWADYGLILQSQQFLNAVFGTGTGIVGGGVGVSSANWANIAAIELRNETYITDSNPYSAGRSGYDDGWADLGYSKTPVPVPTIGAVSHDMDATVDLLCPRLGLDGWLFDNDPGSCFLF